MGKIGVRFKKSSVNKDTDVQAIDFVFPKTEILLEEDSKRAKAGLETNTATQGEIKNPETVVRDDGVLKLMDIYSERRKRAEDFIKKEVAAATIASATNTTNTVKEKTKIKAVKVVPDELKTQKMISWGNLHTYMSEDDRTLVSNKYNNCRSAWFREVSQKWDLMNGEQIVITSASKQEAINWIVRKDITSGPPQPVIKKFSGEEMRAILDKKAQEKAAQVEARKGSVVFSQDALFVYAVDVISQEHIDTYVMSDGNIDSVIADFKEMIVFLEKHKEHCCFDFDFEDDVEPDEVEVAVPESTAELNNGSAKIKVANAWDGQYVGDYWGEERYSER